MKGSIKTETLNILKLLAMEEFCLSLELHMSVSSSFGLGQTIINNDSMFSSVFLAGETYLPI